MKKIAFVSILFFLAGIINAEDDKEYILRKKIQEAHSKIEEYKTKTKETDENTEEFSDSHIKRIEKKKDDILKLKSEIGNLEKELKNENLLNNSLKRSLKNYDIEFALYRNEVKKNMEIYRDSIKKAIPYNVEERNTNLSKLIADTELESIAAEEIFNRYYNFLNRELLTGFDSEVYVKDNIKYLRIGWIILAYSDEKGSDVGLLCRKINKWKWKNDLDFSMRKTIRDSMKIVEGKKAPDLMDFPVPLSLVESDKGGLQ